jgi:hypothetical protein
MEQAGSVPVLNQQTFPEYVELSLIVIHYTKPIFAVLLVSQAISFRRSPT